MINKLQAACDERKASSLELLVFAYEFTNVLEFLVIKGEKPYRGTKCDLLKIIAPRAKQDTLLLLLSTTWLSICDNPRAGRVIDPTGFTYAEFADHILKLGW